MLSSCSPDLLTQSNSCFSHARRLGKALAGWRRLKAAAVRRRASTCITWGRGAGARTNCPKETQEMADQDNSKTGVTLPDTGVRDEHGLEPIEDIFSSPTRADGSEGEADMDLTTGLRLRRVRKGESNTVSDKTLQRLDRAHPLWSRARTATACPSRAHAHHSRRISSRLLSETPARAQSCQQDTTRPAQAGLPRYQESWTSAPPPINCRSPTRILAS
jgi:hypothetical protein